MFKKIERNDDIFKSKLFLQDAIPFSVMISIVESVDRYSNPKVISNGNDCIIVNSDFEHPVIVWTADSFNDYEALRSFVNDEFRNNNPLKVMSKMAFYDFLKAKDKIDNSDVKILGAYQCNKLKNIEYVGRPDNATKEELPIVAELYALFGQETGEDKNATVENSMLKAESFINNSLCKVWRDSDNKIVAITRIRASEKYARLGYVITNPDERGKSYAKMLVHYMTQYARNSDKIPMLFTDFNYAPSNKCYKAVGYNLVCTIANYKLR